MRIDTILLNILAPIVLMVGLGALIRWKFKTDLDTLSKLNIYLFVPAFVFDKVSNSTLPWSDMGAIVGITITQILLLGGVVLLIGKIAGIGRKTLAAIALAVMFYNSGNYGLPLAALAYPKGAEHLVANSSQTFVLMTLNIMTFTVGLGIAAYAQHGDIMRGIIAFLKLPVLPTLIAALLARTYLHGHTDRHLPVAISKTAAYLSDGLVPLALVTLGAQLASKPRWPRWKPVLLVMGLRLFYAPLQMFLMLLGLHFLASRFASVKPLDLFPMPAELLITTAAVPTAVNTLLLTMELDGDTDLAADCVFWTTVVSCATITLWLAVAPMLAR